MDGAGAARKRLAALSGHLHASPPPAAAEAAADHDGEWKTAEVVIVGAGFSGMCVMQRLRLKGVSLDDVVCFEKGTDVGGTWYWNRYPGAACDHESHWYSYSAEGFGDPAVENEWTWSRRYAGGPEIFRYQQWVADRFGLRPAIRFSERVTSCEWGGGAWSVLTDRGSRVRCRHLFLCCGPLSTPQWPSGASAFRGKSLHTAAWEPVDLSGKTVGIIGTGSTGTQVIPEVAKAAGRLVVFQRSAAWCAPRHDKPMTPEHDAKVKADYARLRHNQLNFKSQSGNAGVDIIEEDGGFQIYETFMKRFPQQKGASVVNSREMNEAMQAHLRKQIFATVKDPRTAELLVPRYPVSCKRICITDDYWPAYNRENVELVDASPGLTVGPHGPTVAGEKYPVDVLIYATGFDVFPGSLRHFAIRGDGGRLFSEAWTPSPRSLFGIFGAGFPNMYILTGPQSVGAFSNVIAVIEHQSSWLADLVAHMRAEGKAAVRATEEGVARWVRRCSQVTKGTVWSGAIGPCTTWYQKDRGGEGAVVLFFAAGLPLYKKDVSSWGYDVLRFE